MENNTELNIVKKNAQAYAYKYTDIAEITKFLAERGETYNQEIKRTENGTEYIVTHKINEKGEKYESCEGATVLIRPIANMNEVQAYGSSVTYARRYSLLLAYGLATEDDDARDKEAEEKEREKEREKEKIEFQKLYKEVGKKLLNEIQENGIPEQKARTQAVEYLKKQPQTIKVFKNFTDTQIKTIATNISKNIVK